MLGLIIAVIVGFLIGTLLQIFENSVSDALKSDSWFHRWSMAILYSLYSATIIGTFVWAIAMFFNPSFLTYGESWLYTFVASFFITGNAAATDPSNPAKQSWVHRWSAAILFSLSFATISWVLTGFIEPSYWTFDLWLWTLVVFFVIFAFATLLGFFGDSSESSTTNNEETSQERYERLQKSQRETHLKRISKQDVGVLR